MAGPAYVVLARWVARPGEALAVGRALGELVAASRAESGVLAYHAHRSRDDEGTFVIYERYVDEAAARAHVASDHFRRLALEDAIPRLTDRERTVLEDVDAAA